MNDYNDKVLGLNRYLNILYEKKKRKEKMS